ncbi:MAG: hypothetical protein DRJ03_06405 [Chloroflexi bacterium]|nr:MAG: hypothetical protein B6I35_02320 [Anaerolineaceae bacterium 4572_32.2]RLC72172.1 MAG: hypothetical protein DRI81_16735 [Chloroflexota bacterium]RLC87306.1 MAG: hypothetical protein DRJ03_06405 [Chloroflexota bacterium]
MLAQPSGLLRALREQTALCRHPRCRSLLNPRYNIYHCFLRDPNGYLIEIQRFLDSAWKGTRALRQK